MKIYTKTGDKGVTSLYDSTRIDKDSTRVESYGTIDELNSFLGLARNYATEKELQDIIIRIQRELFDVAGELATKDRAKFSKKINEEHVQVLESIIDMYYKKEDVVDKFIIPGSNHISAYLHVARTVCRRAERRILTLSKTDTINVFLMMYINRLSDLLYVLARHSETNLIYVNFDEN
ncbi:MAG: cob(I)yrinic acid a,c-diamide adenosyltransferase [Alkaliphilus sp.]|nr:cob(I)yrinic acid a,c-diamide adenosyltransferase [Alkaliphilus sp.]